MYSSNCSPVGSLIPLNLLSWCVLSYPLPIPLRCVLVPLWLLCPSLPPSLAAWGTDSAADKAAAAAGRAKQYPGAHCSTAYATKHGWRQPKGQAPRDAPAGLCVSVWCVCQLYFHYPSRSRGFFLVFTRGWIKQKRLYSRHFLHKGLCFGLKLSVSYLEIT